MYEYDDHNRMTAMYTYRTDDGFDTSDWPDSPGEADVTRWYYDEASGLLSSKEDALGRKTRYTYGPGGRLASRAWSRQPDGVPLVTTYLYDEGTGDLVEIDYSDDTPDIAYEYNRRGGPHPGH